MKAIIILITFLLSYQLNAQSRTVYGRVLAEDFWPLPRLLIRDAGNLPVGETDSVGRFKISIPKNTPKLSFYWIGCEKATIKLTGNCDTLEVVMLDGFTYDFMSWRKIDRLRLKDFEKLPELHLQAYNRGLFTKSTPCYSREFEPWKPAMDSIAKEIVKRRKQIKQTFKRFDIGDTVSIPFAGTYRYDGTDRTTLQYYAAFSDQTKFNCILKGVILSKNKHRGGYNLVYIVTDFKLEKDPGVLQDREVKAGQVFMHNMRKYKILNNPVVQKHVTERIAY